MTSGLSNTSMQLAIAGTALSAFVLGNACPPVVNPTLQATAEAAGSVARGVRHGAYEITTKTSDAALGATLATTRSFVIAAGAARHAVQSTARGTARTVRNHPVAVSTLGCAALGGALGTGITRDAGTATAWATVGAFAGWAISTIRDLSSRQQHHEQFMVDAVLGAESSPSSFSRGAAAARPDSRAGSGWLSTAGAAVTRMLRRSEAPRASGHSDYSAIPPLARGSRAPGQHPPARDGSVPVWEGQPMAAAAPHYSDAPGSRGAPVRGGYSEVPPYAAPRSQGTHAGAAPFRPSGASPYPEDVYTGAVTRQPGTYGSARAAEHPDSRWNPATSSWE